MIKSAKRPAPFVQRRPDVSAGDPFNTDHAPRARAARLTVGGRFVVRAPVQPDLLAPTMENELTSEAAMAAAAAELGAFDVSGISPVEKFLAKAATPLRKATIVPQLPARPISGRDASASA